jgi:putative two-component system response regulator
LNERAKILVVDDHPENVKLVRHFFKHLPYDLYSAGDGPSALQMIKDSPPDLILLDLMMPGMNGFEVCQHLKDDPKTCLIPIIMVTAFGKQDDRLHGIELGVDDFLTKPINFLELKTRVASLLRVKRITDELESAEKIIFTLAGVVEARDQYTMEHCRRMAYYGRMLAEKLDMDAQQIQTIQHGAYLHDIGKIAIADNILMKKSKLDEQEFSQIKQHTVIGEKICQPLRTLKPVLPIIRSHHERFDGSGYPDGLKGEHIPQIAQVIALVDCYDAMTTTRPYREALTQSTVIDIFEQDTKNGLWEPKVAAAFIDLIKINGLEQTNLVSDNFLLNSTYQN